MGDEGGGFASPESTVIVRQTLLSVSTALLQARTCVVAITPHDGFKARVDSTERHTLAKYISQRTPLQLEHSACRQEQQTPCRVLDIPRSLLKLEHICAGKLQNKQQQQ